MFDKIFGTIVITIIAASIGITIFILTQAINTL